MKIALFGGSFNPIHYGHLSLAEQARIEFKLDKIIFIPSGKPPHKIQTPLAYKFHRFNMIKLSISNNRFFSINDYEIKKNNISYTFDTIQHFKKKFHKDKFFFLLGLDLLLEIHTWKKYNVIFDLCQVLVGLRPDFSVKKIPKNIYKKVLLFNPPLLDISSTFLREQIKERKSIKYLVPPEVESYIYKNKLYLSI